MVSNENVPQPQAFNTWSPDVVIIWGFGGVTLQRKCVTGAGFESTYPLSTFSLLCFMPAVGMWLASLSSWLPCLPAAMLLQHDETHPPETERNELFLQEVALIIEFYPSNSKVTDTLYYLGNVSQKLLQSFYCLYRKRDTMNSFPSLFHYVWLLGRFKRPEYICCQGVLSHLNSGHWSST